MFIDAFDAIFEPRYTQFSTSLMYLSSSLVVGGISVPWLRTLVFLRLIIRSKSVYADKTDSIVSTDVRQSELRVQHHQQRARLVR